MAGTETETIEQIHYSTEGWSTVARELYRHAGARYPENMRPFAEHLYRKAEHAGSAGKHGFTESVPGPDAVHVRDAARETGTEERPSGDGTDH